MAKRTIEVMKFEHKQAPSDMEIVPADANRYVSWGTNNLYPNYILKLYNESPTHAAIVNSKASMITKGGLRFENGGSVNVEVNPHDTFDEFVDKIVKDYLLFNAFCVEVIYSKLMKPVEYHFVPLHKVRMNKYKDKFFYSDNWKLGGKEIVFGRWKQKATDDLSKFFYFDGYQPSLNNIYPDPEYKHIIKTLQTDIELRDFNLNNIQNSFSVSTLITFFRGSNVPEEMKTKIMNELKASYTGASGKKMIVDFQDAGQQSADVKNISPNDWDKAYELIAKKVNEDILIGHQVTSPMLFGVKTEGQLGGAAELETAYEIFKDNYIKNKRKELTSALNLMFSNSDMVSGKVVFEDKPLFNASISEQTKIQIMTINELRKEQGLPPTSNGDRFVGEASTVQLVSQSKFSSDVFHLSEEDYEKVKDMGIVLEDFDFIEDGEFVSSKECFNRIEMKFEQSQEIADYLLENDIANASINEIKAGLRKDLGINVSNSELTDILQNLTKSGVLKAVVKDGSVSITKPEQSNRKVEVMYSYEVRQGLGAPIIDTTRPFCKKLVQNNRLYTREEVQTMSSIFGYDIFTYGGGYYKNPQTGELTSHCRHQFKSKTVIRRSNQN